MQKRTITLGGDPLEIPELPAKKNAQWRKKLEQEIRPFLDLIEQAGAGADLSNSEVLLRLVNGVWPMLLNSPEIMGELIQAYAPDLVTAEILDATYDSEMADAFLGIIGLAFPFGGLIQRLSSLASGSTGAVSPRISTNSPSLNGVNSPKQSIPMSSS